MAKDKPQKVTAMKLFTDENDKLICNIVTVLERPKRKHSKN